MPAQRKNTFRTGCRFLLLTYAQVKEDFDFNHIVYKAREHHAKYHISREAHKDGGTHYHALFEFTKRFQTRNVNLFDITGHHPNWTTIRYTPHKAYEYVEKDGDVVASNLDKPSPDVLKEAAPRASVWETIASAKTPEEFHASCMALDPRSYINNYSNILKYANTAYHEEIDLSEATHPQFILADDVPEKLKAWVDGFKAGQEAAADENGDTKAFTIKERFAIHTMIYLNI